MSTLRFLHTSPVHIPSFNTVLQDVLASGHIDAAFASELTIQHMDDESLLTEARQTGITPALKARLKATLDEAASGGADFVLCTCSSIGGAAEEMGQQTTVPVLRVDRAMAERAIAQGTRIVVAATLQSTLAPTRDLLLSVAQDAVKEVELIDVVCESAWQAFEAGDQQG
ncbi:MAG: aspartate/glutamate racemase family protein, partial [Chloroflexota bacterium]